MNKPTLSMKKLNCVMACIFTLMLMTAVGWAQEQPICGVPEEMSKWTEQYLAERGAYPKTNNLLYVPLTIHIVGTDEGTGYTPLNSVLNALCTLNEDFAGANIQFYIQGDIRYINDTDFFNHTSITTGRVKHSDYRVSRSINSYIVSNIGNTESVIAGYALAINSDAVVMAKSEMQRDNHTWGHELGHALALYHPHFGWDGQEFNYDNIAPERIGGRLVERADGSNCQIAGDGLCDTSADYLGNQRWNCDENAQSVIVQRDPTGQTFRSDGTNIMSYASDACVNRFSEEQILLMRNNLLTDKGSFLNQSDPAPSINGLTTSPVLPTNGESVDANAAFLQWEAMADASLYMVEVSIVPTFAGPLTETYTSKTNSITLSDLFTNRVYYWRVKAINRNSFCTSFGTSANFRTTVATSASEPIGLDADIQVFPNPLAVGQVLNLQVQASNSTNLDVRLFDTAGRLLQRDHYDVPAGEMTLKFHPGSIAKGIYMLQLVTDKGTRTKRISIQ